MASMLLVLGVAGAAIAAMGVACSDGNEAKTSAASTVASDGGGDAHEESGACRTEADASAAPALDTNVTAALASINEGQKTFRFDTFGDEAFWGGKLGLHRAIEGEKHGGVGPGLSAKTALTLGLKVDATMIPADVASDVKSGKVNLDDPATTLALLKLDAVVGVKGTFGSDGNLASVGIRCSLCHSTVDDSFAPGIGKRLDGWANRDLDVGTIIGLAPDLSAFTTLLGVDEATVRAVLKSWGPGKFDAALILDGKAMRPDGKSGATLIPPAFGMAGVNLHTYTGWGSVPYWNAFVAVLEMHGQGNFTDERLDDAAQFPIAARNKLGHVQVGEGQDLVTPKLPGLHMYQLALQAPKPPSGSFDQAASMRGDTLFNGAAKCGTCHVEPTTTDTGWNMHRGEEIGIDDFQSDRSPDHRYRTARLRGLWTHTKGGFFHDGRFATLLDVVNHYSTTLNLNLTEAQKKDLVEYLKSL